MYTLFHIFLKGGKAYRHETVTRTPDEQNTPLEQATRQAIREARRNPTLPPVLNGLHFYFSAEGPGFARFVLTRQKEGIPVCTSLAVWTIDGLRNAPPGFTSDTVHPSRLPVLISYGGDTDDTVTNTQRALAWALCCA